MSKKFAVVVGLATVLLLTMVGYAAYRIVSNRITVVVEPRAIIGLNANATSCYVLDLIEFFGIVSKVGTPLAGITVSLFYGNDTSTGLSDVTDANGQFSILWTSTQSGTFEFYTDANVP